MTETTATTGTSISPVEEESAEDSAIPEAVHPPGSSGEPPAPEPPPDPSAPDPPPATLAGSSGLSGEQTLPIPGAKRPGWTAAGPERGTGSRADRSGRDRGAGGRPERSGPDGGTGGRPERSGPFGLSGPAVAAEPAVPTAPLGPPDPPFLAGPPDPAGPAGPLDPAAATPPRPAYTRPPGMLPPPDQLVPDDPPGGSDPTPGGVPATAVLSIPGGSYAAAAVVSPVSAAPVVSPVSAPPRATGRAAAGGVTVRPIGAGPGAAVGAAPVPERMRLRPAATPRGPRRARLGVKRIDPWSVMKFSFAVSLVMFIVMIVAASVLYLALDTMGVFESVNSTVADLVDAGGGETGETFRISAPGVIGTSAVLGALNVLLFTSLATLGAFIYNVCADLVGGVEVTLAERD